MKMPEPKKPGLLLCATDPMRACLNLVSMGFTENYLKGLPRGYGKPVLVLPGFLTGDSSTSVLRRTLTGLGYKVYGWELGINLGPRRHTLFAMETLLEDIAERHPYDRISLVGQSLGGIYARILAHKNPELVRQVITLGSPHRVSGADKTWLTPVFKALMGNEFEDAVSQMGPMVESRLEVPATSIYSRLDGVVPWQSCIEEPGPMAENVEVMAAHCGMGLHGPTIRVVADRLAHDADTWVPFNRGRYTRFTYPKPALAA